jgi:hypothetical protein
VNPGPFTLAQLDRMATAKLKEEWKLSALLRLTIARVNGNKSLQFDDLYPFGDE